MEKYKTFAYITFIFFFRCTFDIFSEIYLCRLFVSRFYTFNLNKKSKQSIIAILFPKQKQHTETALTHIQRKLKTHLVGKVSRQLLNEVSNAETYFCSFLHFVNFENSYKYLLRENCINSTCKIYLENKNQFYET